MTGGKVLVACALMATMPSPALTLPAQEAAALTSLPTPECLRALRAARVAQMSGEPAAQLDQLRTAREPCKGRTELLVELLLYGYHHDLPEQEHEVAYRQLLERVKRDDAPISRAIAAHLVWESNIDAELLREVASALERRVSADTEATTPDLRLAADALERADRPEAAITIWERLREQSPSETVDWNLVRLYEQAERWGDAATALIRASEGNDALVGTWSARVIRNLVYGGRFEDASTWIERLFEDSSDLPIADFALEIAWSFRDAEADQDAERLFRIAAEAKSPGPGPRIDAPASDAPRMAQTALAHLYSSDAERQELLAAASEVTQGDPFALYERGTELLTSGQLEPAFELLRQAAPAIGDLEAAWYNLALVAYRLEEWQAAAEAYLKTAAFGGARADVWFFRGLALTHLEQWADAAEALEKALTLDPARALAHYHLSKCYAEVGDAEAASRHLQAWNDSREQK